MDNVESLYELFLDPLFDFLLDLNEGDVTIVSAFKSGSIEKNDSVAINFVFDAYRMYISSAFSG